MPGGSKLFELIQSLSKSEKRYFRMRSSFQIKGEKNQYMRLFESIERQRTYDEAAIAGEFRGTPIGEHLSEAKYYLYRSILKALHTFHAENSPMLTVQTLIHQAEILLERGLSDQCPALLAKARKLALAHEMWGVMPQILTAEYKLMMLDIGLADMDQRMEGLFDAMREYQALDAERVAYWGHNISMFTIYRAMGAPRSERDLAPFRALMEEDPMRGEAIPRTAKARAFYYQSIALFCDLNNDFEGALDANRVLLQLEREVKVENRRNIAVALSNTCIAALRAQRPDQFLTHYPELLQLTDPRGHGRLLHRYLQVLGLRVYFLCLAGLFTEAAAGMKAIEEIAAERGCALDDHEITIGLVTYFGIGDYARCVDYQNALLSLRNKRENIHLVVRTLALIVHFELRRFDLLEYLLKSTYKYLLSKDKVYRFERAIIDFIRAALGARNDAELRTHFCALHTRLESLMSDPFERVPMEIVDLVAWLEAKRTGRTFAEVVRERFRARHGDIMELAREFGAEDILIAATPGDAWQSAA